MKKLFITLSLILAIFAAKFLHQKLWLNSSPKPYEINPHVIPWFCSPSLRGLTGRSNPADSTGLLHSLCSFAMTRAEHKILLGQKININTAAQKELEVLSGIGPALSAKIIAKRGEVGGFKSLEDLKLVHGIGGKKLARIRQFIDIR